MPLKKISENDLPPSTMNAPDRRMYLLRIGWALQISGMNYLNEDQLEEKIRLIFEERRKK